MNGKSFLSTLLADLREYEPRGDEVALKQIVGFLNEQGVHALYLEGAEVGHITASGFVLSPDGLRALLIFHHKLQLWLQPGGHVEPEDLTPDEACRREIEEETGVTALKLLGLFDVDVHEIPNRPGEPAHLHFDVRYAYQAASTDAFAGDGAEDVAWVSLDAEGFEESVSRPLRKLQARN